MAARVRLFDVKYQNIAKLLSNSSIYACFFKQLYGFKQLIISFYLASSNYS